MLNCYYMDTACDCSCEQLQDLCKIIPDDRMEKIDRLKNADIARKSMLVGAFLQYSLGMALGISVNEISYRYGEFGKPMLSDSVVKRIGQIDFNLSHSGKYVILAVSDVPVGIDIEQLRGNWISVANRCFCKEEYEDIIAAGKKEDCDKRFLEYWTMKEAYVKWSGEGMHRPFRSFLIKRQENSLSYVEQDEAYFVTLFFETYCISVCSGKKDVLNKIRKCGNPFQNYMREVTLEDIF